MPEGQVLIPVHFNVIWCSGSLSHRALQVGIVYVPTWPLGICERYFACASIQLLEHMQVCQPLGLQTITAHGRKASSVMCQSLLQISLHTMVVLHDCLCDSLPGLQIVDGMQFIQKECSCTHILLVLLCCAVLWLAANLQDVAFHACKVHRTLLQCIVVPVHVVCGGGRNAWGQ